MQDQGTADNQTVTITEGSAFSLVETYWGYIVGRGAQAQKRAAYGEITAMIASMMFGVIAYCQWLLPGTINDVEILPFKIGGTVVFFVFAFLNYTIARKGLSYEVQVDLHSERIRQTRRNREGSAMVLETSNFRDVRAIYIKPPTANLGPSRLYLEIKGQDAPVFAAAGTDAEMKDLLQRMTNDIQPRVRMDDAPAKAGGFGLGSAIQNLRSSTASE